MSRDQRVADNHALLSAQLDALEHSLPLIVLFNISPKTGHRSREQYIFMLEGLKSVEQNLLKLNIPFVISFGNASDQIVKLCHNLRPTSIYFDFNPMYSVRSMQQSISDKLNCSVYLVDTHNIIPAWVVSDKREYAAHTMRRKVHLHLESYLVEPVVIQRHPFEMKDVSRVLKLADASKKLDRLPANNTSIDFISGSLAARKRLKMFIDDKLAYYALMRNDIADDYQSGLSPYLHFGQISSLRVALEVHYAVEARPLLFDHAKLAQHGTTPNKSEGLNALFEEMIVRKELSDNYCLYADNPSHLSAAEPWAQQTLADHMKDPREHVYTRSQLEHAQTHDEAWNAAQTQMTQTGKMHGCMRMYWAKKILEWSKSPQEAIDTAVYLNDHYSLDGGDPNGYVGIMWSIAGVHDRPWTERPIFGKVRYMNEAGLRRKFDVDSYTATWQESDRS